MRYQIELPRKSSVALLAEAVLGKPKRLLLAVPYALFAAFLATILSQWARTEPEIAAAGFSALPVVVVIAAGIRRLLRGPVDPTGAVP